MSVKKYIGYAVSVLFIIACLIDFIYTCTGFKDANQLTDTYGLRGFTITLLVMELIFTFVMIGIAVLVIYKIYSEVFDLDEAPTSVISALVLALALLLHITTDMAVGYGNWLANYVKGSLYSYEAPASAVATIVLTVLAIIALFVAVVYNNNSTVKKVVGAIGVLCMIAVYIVVFCNLGDNPYPLTVVINVILFIGVILTGVFLFIPGYMRPRRRYYSSSYRSNTQTSSSSQQTSASGSQTSSSSQQTTSQTTSSEDPVKKLKELKELLDSNIITQEEYEEKRKKYLDKI